MGDEYEESEHRTAVNPDHVPPVPRSAATVMLLRDAPGGLEVYMTRRSAKSRFVPEVFVFPGGRVDDGDRSARILARLVGTGDGRLDAGLTIAAVRELFEEAGILLARQREEPGTLNLHELGHWRAKLAAGEKAFADFIEERDLVIDASGIVPYSNWITPISEPIRFDTHFFVARAPEDQEAIADAYEVYDGRWIAPKEALALADGGALRMIFPTYMHLTRLAQADSVEAMLAAARAQRIDPILPVFLANGEPVLPSGTDW